MDKAVYGQHPEMLGIAYRHVSSKPHAACEQFRIKIKGLSVVL